MAKKTLPPAPSKNEAGKYTDLSRVAVSAPTNGALDTTSPFGIRSDPFLGRPAMHTGIDFKGAEGDPIKAVLSGKVVHAGTSNDKFLKGFGNYVEIDHGDGLSTRYGHASAVNVKVGQNVEAGAKIGEIGSTGRSTGAHLHYEVRLNGDAIDPRSKHDDPRVAKVVEAMAAQNLKYGVENNKDTVYFKPGTDPKVGVQVAGGDALSDNVKPVDKSAPVKPKIVQNKP